MSALSIAPWVQQNGAVAVNLTLLGLIDWWHLNNDGGGTSTANSERMLGATDLTIPTVVGTLAQPINYTGDNATFSWSNGEVVPSGSDDTAQYMAPTTPPNLTYYWTGSCVADTNIRTLRLYLGSFGGRGTLFCSLSDVSSPNAQALGQNAADLTVENGYFDITFQAASAGQTMTWIWQETTDNGAGGSGNSNISCRAGVLMSKVSPGVPVAWFKA